MNIYILFFIIILLISIENKTYESFADFYLGQPTKCFSCQEQLPYKLKFLGGKTKCFSCERDMANRYGIKYAGLGNPTKCFSCESQMGKKPF